MPCSSCSRSLAIGCNAANTIKPPRAFKPLGGAFWPKSIGKWTGWTLVRSKLVCGGTWPVENASVAPTPLRVCNASDGDTASTNKFQGASFACNRGGDALLNAAGSRRNKALHYAFNVCGQRTEPNAPTKTSAERPLAFKPWLEAISNSNVFNKSEPRHSCFRRYGKARWFANV